jgi:hypothetical protein
MTSSAGNISEGISSKNFRTSRYRNTRSELTELYQLYVLVFEKSPKLTEADVTANDAAEITAALAVLDRQNKHPRSIEGFFHSMKHHGYMASLPVEQFPRRRVRSR